MRYAFRLVCVAAIAGILFAIGQSTYSWERNTYPMEEKTVHQHSQLLSAFYQCYERPRAALEVLKRFRKHYPFSLITMVNDGGNPVLEKVANKYHANYEYANRTSYLSSAMYFESCKAAVAYIRRILEASRHCDWLLLLEDDVWVLKNIPFDSFIHDINGGHTGMILSENLMTVIKSRRPDLNTSQYGGNGGSVLKCSFFREFLNSTSWELDIENLILAKQGIASDELISSIAYIYGGTIGIWEGYAETGFASYWYRSISNSIVVLHQAKYLY